NNFGLHYRRIDNLSRALEENEEAIRLHEQLMRGFPQRIEFAINFASSVGNQADLLHNQGKVPEALEWYSKSIDALSPLKEDTAARLALYGAHLGRAGAYLKLKQPDEAAKDWRRAVELSEGGRHFNYLIYRPRALAYL